MLKIIQRHKLVFAWM